EPYLNEVKKSRTCDSRSGRSLNYSLSCFRKENVSIKKARTIVRAFALAFISLEYQVQFSHNVTFCLCPKVGPKRCSHQYLLCLVGLLMHHECLIRYGLLVDSPSMLMSL